MTRDEGRSLDGRALTCPETDDLGRTNRFSPVFDDRPAAKKNATIGVSRDGDVLHHHPYHLFLRTLAGGLLSMLANPLPGGICDISNPIQSDLLLS